MNKLSCINCHRLGVNVDRSLGDVRGAVRRLERKPESLANRALLNRRKAELTSARETLAQHEATCFPVGVAA